MTTEDAIQGCEDLAAWLEKQVGGQHIYANDIRTVLTRLAAVEHERARLIERWPSTTERTVISVSGWSWAVMGTGYSFPTREAAVLAAAGLGGDAAKGEADGE